MTDAQPAEKTLWPLEHVIEWLKSAEMKRTTPKTHPFESDMMPDELQRDAARHLEILTRRIRELEGELRTAAKVPVDPTYAKDCYILRLERERDEFRQLARENFWGQHAAERDLLSARARLATAESERDAQKELTDWTRNKWKEDWAKFAATYDMLQKRAEKAERERDEARVRLADHVLWTDELEARLAQAREALDRARPFVRVAGCDEDPDAACGSCDALKLIDRAIADTGGER